MLCACVGVLSGLWQLVVVVKHDTTHAVFGVYIHDKLTGEHRFVGGHAENFLFRLDSIEAIKLKRVAGESHGVYMDVQTGLVVGLGPDFVLTADGGACNPLTFVSPADGFASHSLPLTGNIDDNSWSPDDVTVEIYQVS